MHYFLQYLLEQSKKEVDKVFRVSKQTNLVEIWLGGRVEEITVRAFLLIPRLIAIKYPKHITLWDIDTVILLKIVIIIGA